MARTASVPALGDSLTPLTPPNARIGSTTWPPQDGLASARRPGSRTTMCDTGKRINTTPALTGPHGSSRLPARADHHNASRPGSGSCGAATPADQVDAEDNRDADRQDHDPRH